MREAIGRLARAIRTASLTAILISGCLPTATPTPGPTTQAPIASANGPGSSSSATADPVAPLRLVIDTDMAPDDVVAIASLLRDPAVEVLAITVVGTGEAHCPGGMFVARAMVTMLRDDAVPVACGRWTAMGEAQEFPAAWRAGADAGNGLRLVSPTYAPDERVAEALLLELAAAEVAAGRRLTILTLGTLTNLASAVTLDPSFARQVRVVSMLGAVGVAGNVQPEIMGTGQPTAEWNAHADPTAVRMVLEAGVDLTLVPLDATNDTPLTRELFQELERDHAAGPADLVYELWARNPFMTGGDYYLWDPLAAVAIREPAILGTRTATLRVIEGAGLDGGRLVEDPAGARVTIATSADRGAFEERLLASLRLGAPRGAPFEPVATVSVSVAPDECEVRIEPTPPPSGLFRLDLRSTAPGPASALVFGLAGIPWADLEAFAAAPDFDNPPPVAEVAGAFLEGPGSTTAWGTSEDGPVGVGCLLGSFERPTLRLRGPFEVGD